MRDKKRQIVRGKREKYTLKEGYYKRKREEGRR